MKITKTTINYAKARSIELVIDDSQVAFFDMNDDCEPMFFYSINKESGEMFFKSNIWLKQSAKEELPHWIATEQKLRHLINYLASQI